MSQTAPRKPRKPMTAPRKPFHVEVYQADGIDGFACYLRKSAPKGRALIGLNIEALLGTVAMGDVEPSELPYYVAECIMHEIVHALEEWAGVAFNEERIHELVDRYRGKEKGITAAFFVP